MPEGWYIFLRAGECEGEFPTRILLPEEYIRDGFTRRVPEIPRVHKGRNFVCPRHENRRSLQWRESEDNEYWNAPTDSVTTTVFGFAAASFSTSSSVRPGNVKVVRSFPSVSQSLFNPTIAITASASFASATASARRSSGSTTSAPPSRTPGLLRTCH